MTHLPALLAAALISSPAANTPAVSPETPPAIADDFWAHAHWDDDHDDRRRYGPMPRPDQSALRAVGVVRVLEVDREDGRLEIEGLDARGRNIDVVMNASGRRVLAWRIDHHDDDRWDR